MRNTIILVGILVAALLIYFAFVHKQNAGSLAEWETEFAIDDTAAVTKIHMTCKVDGKTTKQVILEKDKGEWKLNQKYTALTPRVNKLLETLHDVEVREPLKEAGRESARMLLAKGRTEIEVYNEKGLMKAYWVGSETPDRKGTLMQLAESSNPYVLEIPGQQGYLNIRYSTDSKEWREKYLFKADLALIEQMHITHNDSTQTLEDIGVSLIKNSQSNAWQLQGVAQGIDSTKLKEFLALFDGKKIYAESFAGDNYKGKYLELSTQKPDVRFHIKYTDGTNRSILIYRRQENKNNYFGWIEGENELLTIQQYVFEKFMVDKTFFVGQNM